MKNLYIDGLILEEQPLGSGCSGEVFKAKEEQTEDFVVAKRYNPMSIDRHLMEEMLYRQTNATEHEGIIPLKKFQFDRTPYYTVARYERGKSLINCSQFDDAQARDLIRGIADAMGHAHQFGLFHGNLHPGNIFYHFDENLNMKASIGDFGAGMIGEVHYVDLGESAYFAAPEQLECLGSDYKFGNAERWDVYRFGAIAFWIINRIVPRGKTYREYRAEQIANSGGRPVPVDPLALSASMMDEAELPWIPLQAGSKARRYQEIIESCLALKQSDRPRDMQEVTRDIGRLDAEARRQIRLEKRERIQKAKERKIKADQEAAAEVQVVETKEKTSSSSRILNWFRPRKKARKKPKKTPEKI